MNNLAKAKERILTTLADEGCSPELILPLAQAHGILLASEYAQLKIDRELVVNQSQENATDTKTN